MAREAALAARDEVARKRTLAAFEALVDEDLLVRLKGAGQPARDARYAQTAQNEVIADIAEHLAEKYASVPAGGLDKDVTELLAEAGYDGPEAIRKAPDEELLAIKGIGSAKLQEIRETTGPHAPVEEESQEESDNPPPVLAAALGRDLVELLHNAGYVDIAAVREASDDELLSIKGVGPARLTEIREALER
jgi:DNA-directed RNA polymerase alpha subunit